MIRKMLKDSYTSLIDSKLVPDVTTGENPIDLDSEDLQKLSDNFLDAVELVPIEREQLIPKQVIQLYNDIVDGIVSLDGASVSAPPVKPPVEAPVESSVEAPVESSVEATLIDSAQEQVAKDLGYTEVPEPVVPPVTTKKKAVSKSTNVFGRRSSSRYGFIDDKLLKGITMADLEDLLVVEFSLDKNKVPSIIKGHIKNVTVKRKEADLLDTDGILKFVPKEAI